MKKKCVCNNLAIVVLGIVLGAPRVVQPNLQCPCFSLVPEAKYEVSRGSLKGAVSIQKSYSRVRDIVKGVARRNRRE